MKLTAKGAKFLCLISGIYLFRHCNNIYKGSFQHIFLKPYYRFIEYGVCPNCEMEVFIDYRQYAPGKEVKKEYQGLAARRQLKYWKEKLANTFQGTKSNEHFYFGTYSKIGNHYRTYRTNFNNEKELISKQRTRTIHI